MIPGSAIAFKANKARLDAPEVLCYASKSEGMFVRESLIFRSDSNGEDLEGYAGVNNAVWEVTLGAARFEFVTHAAADVTATALTAPHT